MTVPVVLCPLRELFVLPHLLGLMCTACRLQVARQGDAAKPMTGRDWRQRWLGTQPVAPVYGITLVAARAKCKYKVSKSRR